METNHVYHRIFVLYEKCYWAVYALLIRRIFSGSLVGLIAHFVGLWIHIQYHQKLDPASQITECSVTASTGNPLYVVSGGGSDETLGHDRFGSRLHGLDRM